MGKPYINKKADRSRNAEHWKHILSYQELTKLIQETPTKAEWEKPFYATAVLTGARVSEILALKKKDIVWFDSYKRVLTNPNYLDVNKVEFHLENEKNKHMPFKIVPVKKKLVFGALLNIVFDHWKQTPTDETRLFEVSRVRAWQCFKERFGINFFPHLMRHFGASNDVIARIDSRVLRLKYGWADERMLNNYAHLNTQNIEDSFDLGFPDSFPSKVSDSVIIVPPKVPDIVIEQVERLPDAPKLPDEVKLLPAPLSKVVEIVQPKPIINKTVMQSIENKRIIQKVLKKPLPRRVLLIKRGVVNA